MNNNVIRMVNDNKAQVSKTFMKNSKIYGTPEYKLMREFKAENPNCEVVVKTIKKNPDKKTNKNLTYKNIELYISGQDNSEEILKEYMKVREASKLQKSPYKFVLDWFMERFKGFDSYKQFFKDTEKNETTDENSKPTLIAVNGN